MSESDGSAAPEAHDDSTNVRIGVVGLGKMGLSHLSAIRAHPSVEVVGVADATGYILDVLTKYTGLTTFSSAEAMADAVELDAVIIATPTRLHAPMVKAFLERGIDVFCEKPLSLSSRDSDELTELAEERGRVTQVGYHNRFVGAFREVKRLLDAGAIGRVTHMQAEAYGPVVLRSRGSTWRSNREEGGGALYDYVAHPLDLLTWYAGEPLGVGGTVLGSVFSENTEDEVYSTLYFPGGVSGQLSVNWSDESFRKMTTMVTITGTAGRIHADRQEVQTYLRDTAPAVPGYETGWNVRYTTELTDEVWFYLRGEEYSAQLDYFVRSVRDRRTDGTNSFRSAAVTDRVMELLTRDAAIGPSTLSGRVPEPALATTQDDKEKGGIFSWLRK
jgi:predicted dehydrogenase